jgi:signal transduction histidine kinase
MNAAMISHDAPADEKGRRLRKAAESILRATERMKNLIADLLDVASIEAGHLSVTRVSEDPNALVAEIIEVFTPHANEKALHLVNGLADEPMPRVACDRARIFQVFSNLIGNAIKFTAGRGTVEVQRAMQAEGAGEVAFCVRDTGPGIPADQLPRIFERYWQGAESDRASAGLGLFIVKGIVDAHGGRVWAESEVGKGSAVYFTLPVA